MHAKKWIVMNGYSDWARGDPNGSFVHYIIYICIYMLYYDSNAIEFIIVTRLIDEI